MLNNQLDSEKIRRFYRINHRILIPDIFQEDHAEAFHEALVSSTEWKPCSYGVGASPDMDGVAPDKSDPGYRAIRETGSVSREKNRFSFHYYGFNLHARKIEALNRFLDFISNDPGFKQLITHITGENGINYVAAQATCFKPGCFLRTHNDLHYGGENKGEQGKTRRVAFVFNFTRQWSPDWGGMFHVLDDNLNIVGINYPLFNSLTLFRVPTWHFVSPVARYAEGNRYAISGWFMDVNAK